MAMHCKLLVIDIWMPCRYPVIFFVVALVLLFYVHLNSCASYVESWVGMLAPQVGISCPGHLCSHHSIQYK